jgi:hypothetical protein
VQRWKISWTVLLATCGARAPAPDPAKPTEPIYAAMFRVGQTWKFPVDNGEDNEAATILHCTVTDLHEYRTARLVTVACEPSESTITPLFAGRFLATAAGLWAWPPKSESEDPDQELDPKQMLVPATVSELHRTIPADCLESAAPAGSYSLLPWKDAWCATVVRGCNSTWQLQCFRPHVGWIGGAWHGFPDPSNPHAQEVRWGDAPAYPFGMD